MPVQEKYTVTTVEELTALYDAPQERALLKVQDHLDAYGRAFIAASPFLTLATCGLSSGIDCSPRGDYPGFVQFADDTTLLIPDRPGNNRLDSIRNIVENPSVGILFLIPGINETFRVNGTAQLSIDPDLLARFVVHDRTPRMVIVVTVQEAYKHCSRAPVRADLWNASRHIQRSDLPGGGGPAAYDAQAAEAFRKTLY